jgi:hypothetical protein
VGVLQAGEVLGHLTGVRLHDRRTRLGADAAQVGQGAGGDAAVQLALGQRVEDGGRGAERRDPVRGLAGALQEEGDPPERGRGREGRAQLAFFACLAAFFCAFAARLAALS